MVAFFHYLFYGIYKWNTKWGEWFQPVPVFASSAAIAMLLLFNYLFMETVILDFIMHRRDLLRGHNRNIGYILCTIVLLSCYWYFNKNHKKILLQIAAWTKQKKKIYTIIICGYILFSVGSIFWIINIPRG